MTSGSSALRHSYLPDSPTPENEQEDEGGRGEGEDSPDEERDEPSNEDPTNQFTTNHTDPASRTTIKNNRPNNTVRPDYQEDDRPPAPISKRHHIDREIPRNDATNNNRGVHPDAESSGLTDPDVPVCAWNDCGSVYNTLQKLVDHISEEHIGWKKAVYTCRWTGCPRIGITQTSRFALISHLRGHTGERPFDCPVPECDKSFTRSDALAKHLKCQHIDAPRRLLGTYAALMDNPSPRKKNGATTNKPKKGKRKAGEQPQEDNDHEADEHAVPPPAAEEAGVEGTIPPVEAGDGDLASDDDLETLSIPLLKERYKLLKAKYSFIRNETDVLAASYESVRRRLKRLKTEKEVLLDTLATRRESARSRSNALLDRRKAQGEGGGGGGGDDGDGGAEDRDSTTTTTTTTTTLVGGDTQE